MINITYKTHSTGGLLFGLLFLSPHLLNLLNTLDTISVLIIFIIYLYSLYFGSISPDIDHPKSHIGKIFPLISRKIYSQYGHRTITHSLYSVFTLIIFSYLFLLLFKISFFNIYSKIINYILPIPIGYIIGYISHLFFDMFNSKGICIFYPLKKKYRLSLAPNIIVNSSDEKQFNSYLKFLISILLVVYMYTIFNIFIKHISILLNTFSI